MAATRIGVLGGGQLGRMLALAGAPLGLKIIGLDPNPQAPMADVAQMVPAAAFDDPQALDALAAQVDVVTWEFENVPAAAAARLAERVAVHPAPKALEIAQDRLPEKRFFRDLGIGTAPFAPVSGPADFAPALAATGLPALLKTRRLGYDGKGQRWVRAAADLPAAFAALGAVPCLLEGAVPFDRELSVVAARAVDGEIRCYPLVQNTHRDGILVRTEAPAAACPPALQAAAERIAATTLGALGYVGVLAIELFQVGDALWVNEFAPRVHNSGHWTQDGARCDQFEQHLRAVAGLPLGDPACLHPQTVMLNLLGEAPPAAEVLAEPLAHLHLYAKAPRPGRKLGHVNLAGPAPAVAEAAARLQARLSARSPAQAPS